jgi:hypothetical protein
MSHMHWVTRQNKLETCNVSNRIVTFTSVPTPHSRSSLSHGHKFMGFFHNRISVLTDPVIPTTCSVSNNIVPSDIPLTSVPTPRLRSSLSHTHEFTFFLKKRSGIPADVTTSLLTSSLSLRVPVPLTTQCMSVEWISQL